MNRRSFLYLASLPLLERLANSMPAAGDQIERIGLQLYTVRDLMQADMARTLSAVAAVGYREVEFAGYFGHPAPRIRTFLDASGLSAPSTHLSLEDLTERMPATLDHAEAIGHRYLVVPSLDPRDRRSLDDYRRVAERLNRAGEAARLRNMRVAYHNHDFELDPIGGVLPYDVLLRETEPNLVAFEMDFYWMTNGGTDPVTYFQRHAGRFELCHIKDRGRWGRMADVGAGRIDFAAILRQRARAGLRHYYVEHDHPGDPLRSIRASYEYLDGLRF